MSETEKGTPRRVRARLMAPDGSEVFGGVELVAQWQASDDAILWLDLQGPEDDAEKTLLTETFGAARSTLQTLYLPRHPPKLESFDDHLFMLLRGLDARSDSIDFGTIQIGLLIGERYLVTRHADESPSTDGTWEEVDRRPSLLADGPGVVALRLARRLAERYLPIVLNLEKRLEEIEEEMFDRPGDELIEELMVYKRQLKRLRRIASYHVTVFTRLQNEAFEQIPESLDHRVNEVWGQMERIASLSTLYNELANDLMNGYLSLSSHRLNHIMKVLTIVTVIFVPLTFIAGIYGMNFENMPELRTGVGYFVVLGVMGAVSVVLLLMFRIRGWV